MYGYNTNPVYSNKGLKNKLRQIKRNINKKKFNVSETNTELSIELKPAFKMFTEIIQIKDVKKGEFIGYGAAFRAKKDMKIAILPVGYDDGIFRRSTGRFVTINNKRYQIIGDVCMGMIFVEIDNSVSINDKVTLIGDLTPIKEVAVHNGTSIYETMCNIGKQIPRVYIKNNEISNIEEGK